MKINEPPCLTWVVANDDGPVMYSHCTCKAGLGECCSHVGSLLWAISTGVSKRERTTVTSQKSYWMMPSPMTKVPFSRIKDIEFSNSHTHKSASSQDVVFDDSIFQDLSNCKEETVILSVSENFSEKYEPYENILMTSINFETLFDKKYLSAHSLQDFTEGINEFFHGLNITPGNIEQIEEITRTQKECKNWFRLRTGRITASNAKQVCRTAFDNPSFTLLKKICYPVELQQLKLPSILHGNTFEPKARLEYSDLMAKSHVNF